MNKTLIDLACKHCGHVQSVTFGHPFQLLESLEDTRAVNYQCDGCKASITIFLKITIMQRDTSWHE